MLTIGLGGAKAKAMQRYKMHKKKILTAEFHAQI